MKDNIIILDGKSVSQKLLEKDMKAIQEIYITSNKIRLPKLIVISVGDDDASKIYIKNKQKMCKECNIEFIHLHYSETINFNDLANIIDNLNKDKTIDGILIQQPLPKHLYGIDQLVDKDKDVDGFTSYNIGNTLLNKEDSLKACTPYGIIRLLDYYNISLEGKTVTILGRSNIVGKPLIGLLLSKNATVVSCNSFTKDLKSFTSRSNVIISAIGKPKLINSSHITSNCQCIIDVGINRDESNKLCGDVDFLDIYNYWSIFNNELRYITPVPGGVGPMTVETLIHNVYISYRNNLRRN